MNVSLHLPPDVLGWLDGVRGSMSRRDWVCRLVSDEMRRAEGMPAERGVLSVLIPDGDGPDLDAVDELGDWPVGLDDGDGPEPTTLDDDDRPVTMGELGRPADAARLAIMDQQLGCAHPLSQRLMADGRERCGLCQANLFRVD